MFKLQNYFLALTENKIWIANAIQKFNMSSEYIMRKCFMCHIWPCKISKKLCSTLLENENYTVKFFCMIPAWFLGNHIWSLYDYQEFIQIIYDLIWILRIIYDLPSWEIDLWKDRGRPISGMEKQWSTDNGYDHTLGRP